MKKILAVSLLALASACASSAPEHEPVGKAASALGDTTIDILWIGNSYIKYPTLSVDIPATVGAFAAANGKTVAQGTRAVLGWTLTQHNNDATTISLINSKPWDIVVLQDQSDNYQSSAAMLPGVQALLTRIHNNNACTRVLIYDIPAWNDPWSAFTQTTFTNTCKSVANTIDEGVSPAGEGWRAANAASYNLLNLFDDSQHPSERGEYLISDVFYRRIFAAAPATLPALPGVSAADGVTLDGFAAGAMAFNGGVWEWAPAGAANAPNWCSFCPAEGETCGVHFVSQDPAACRLTTPYSHGPQYQLEDWKWFSTGCGCGYKYVGPIERLSCTDPGNPGTP